ncbi:MAG: HAMP domain-containing histidine kinase [Planctomycetaceae bacterium]|nr:HAMP domain-containing histidine kinase [Planctomycetaceae bacterium]
MLLTRSIRRKMVAGLGVLLLMLGLLAIGSISGLSNYKRTVKDLELIEAAPRNSRLIGAVVKLIDPLHLEKFINDRPESTHEELYKWQRKEAEQALHETREVIEEHKQQLDLHFEGLSGQRFAPDNLNAQRESYSRLRAHINDILAKYEWSLDALEDPDKHDATSDYILSLVTELPAAIEELEELEPLENMHPRLKAAQRDYRAHLVLVWSTSLLVLSMFLFLSISAYRGIVKPIRALHRGASRVASGDYDYRVKLNTHDEISHLAVAFNHMTERFQSVTADLDKEVKQQSQQLVHSAKLAGVGFLAAGVAHEINNPLHAISTAAEGVQMRLAGLLKDANESDAEIVREYLKMMQSEASRCRKITEKLLDFARSKETERNQYDVTAIVREVVAMLNHVGKFRDRTITFDENAPHYAYVNGSEIKQVALNIIANALDATKSGGEVTIDIHELPDAVELTCKDNGCGMTPEVLEHLFEPFYTTKDTGKGTGLGLSISHRIVRDHNGVLEASSDGPGQGSKFLIRLPKSPRQAKAA